MIAKAAILFLVGTTLTSAQFFPRIYVPLKHNGCPSGPELAPIICKFMQQNIAPQFKPQLIAPTTYIAPLVVEKCDKPQLQDMELPAQFEDFKPVVIPEAPELPPMTIPKFPLPIIFEEPAPLQEPCESADIPVMPVNIPSAPQLPTWEIHDLPKTEERPEPYLNEEVRPEIDLNTIEYEPISIPQPPELPTFVMPKIPIHVVTEPAAPRLEDEPIPAPIPVYIEPAAPLPAAPELPAFVMPELPKIEVVQPELPLPAAPYLEDEPIPAPIPAYFEPLAPVPAAPELPGFRMPELPTIQAVQPELPMPAAPCLEDEPIPAPIPAYFEPLAPVPAAPELPAFVMPELPTIQAVQPELPMPAAPYLEDEPIPAPIPAYFEPLAPVPAAPELPAFEMPELPTIEAVQPELPMPAAPCLEDEPILAPIPMYVKPAVAVPAAPELPAFVMPELPEIKFVEPELPIPVAPYQEEEPIPAPIRAYFEPLAPVPAAPELPGFVMPELPTIQAVQPELPMPAAPCLEDELILAPIPMYVKPAVAVPAAPELPAFVMPELPEIKFVEPELPIPVAPYQEEEPIRAPIPAYFESLAPVPAAPELPTFVMPELPKIEVVQPELPMPAAPYLEDEPIPAPIIAYVEPLAPVPAAPQLPAFIMPELPTPVVEQELPIRVPYEPTPFMPMPALRQPFPEYNMVDYEHAPELPAFVMPEMPVYMRESPAPAEPCLDDSAAPIVAVPEYIQPLAPVPAAPELPPASLPELPLRVEVPSSPVMIAPKPSLTEARPAEPIFIPQPPALPEIKMPELPVRVAIEESAPCEPAIMLNPFYQKLFPNIITIYNEKTKETQNILLPSQPIESTPCVYNLVMKHVMPNMLSNKFRSMENIETKPASFLPCS